MRATAHVTSPAELVPGDHLCWSYDSDEAFHRLLAEYLAAGVEAGDKLLCFTPPDAVDPVLAELDRLVPRQGEALLDAGRLVFVDARAAYTPDGCFDEDRLLTGFQAEAVAAVDEGYRALRAAGETAWLFGEVDPARVATYEARCDRLAVTLPLTGLCTYDTRGWAAEDVAAVHAVHPASYGASPEAPPFRVHARADGGIAVVGEVDHFTAAAFARALADALALCDRPLVDLSGLCFADVAALRTLAGTLAAQRALGHVELRGMRSPARRCWELLRLGRVAPAADVA